LSWCRGRAQYAVEAVRRGTIEFEENGIATKTAELLQELIGFGLVKITPTA
jgi:hypothetical protein